MGELGNGAAFCKSKTYNPAPECTLPVENQTEQQQALEAEKNLQRFLI